MWRILAILVVPCVAGVSFYSGVCDASAAIWLGADRFAVAGDEENIIRVYSLSVPGNSLSSMNLQSLLGKKEADLEGGTKIGDKLFWIGSHGTSKTGKIRLQRQVLFATDTSLRISGIIYKDLLEQLPKPPFPKENGFTPEQLGGLNVEALAADPNGKLWIGFRNPVVQEGAFVIALENPLEVLKGSPARLGAPILLSLGGLGLRSMEWNSQSNEFWIVAGSFDDSSVFALYRWDGNRNHAPKVIAPPTWKGLRPEGLFFTNQSAVFVSDDGGKACNEGKPQFRILKVPLTP